MQYLIWAERNEYSHHFVQGLFDGQGVEVAIPMFEYKHDKTGSVTKAKSRVLELMAPRIKNITVTISNKGYNN